MLQRLRLKDWIGVAFGAWIFASPWALGYTADTTATVNALAVGYALVLVELFELGAHDVADEWIYVVAGSWLIFSPMVLHFDSALAAGLNGVVAGSLMVAYAIASMWRGMLAGPDDRRANPT